MSYPVSPLRTSLPRQVLQWLLNLELAPCLRNVRSHAQRPKMLLAFGLSQYIPIAPNGVKLEATTLFHGHEQRPDRDFSNGYLVADIFSRYYPKVFLLYSYENGTALSIKRNNWTRIQKFLQKLHINLPQDLINGTMHLEIGAAEKLLVQIYSILTNQSPNCESSLSTAQSEWSAEREGKVELLHHERQHWQRTHRTGQAAALYKEIKVHQPIRRYIQQ